MKTMNLSAEILSRRKTVRDDLTLSIRDDALLIAEAERNIVDSEIGVEVVIDMPIDHHGSPLSQYSPIFQYAAERFGIHPSEIDSDFVAKISVEIDARKRAFHEEIAKNGGRVVSREEWKRKVHENELALQIEAK